ncbi:hypothetical protein [Persicitalea jodogahamensis]|uniref:hypothetical protein n=1 Tax=Persicitalea jodogahamensis TaxID=402147 RepID=UPI001679FEA4|nr:hypothetical protein [Persicitalea jodogahamensis]
MLKNARPSQVWDGPDHLTASGLRSLKGSSRCQDAAMLPESPTALALPDPPTAAAGRPILGESDDGFLLKIF